LLGSNSRRCTFLCVRARVLSGQWLPHDCLLPLHPATQPCYASHINVNAGEPQGRYYTCHAPRTSRRSGHCFAETAIKTGSKDGEQKLTDPRSTSHRCTKRNLPPSPRRQSATPTRCRVSRATSWQETRLARTRSRKTETSRNRTRSTLPTSNRLLTYETILRPIWTYGMQLWGTASASNKEILERFRSGALRVTVDAPWFLLNTVISAGISKHQQLKKKFAATALNTARAQTT
jgi:hypothetical protein